ncbi:MAG TPA: integrase arm-type DNA-binding domain-containing protein, partial [Terriglobia bacterium]|nr:integrase arm-type DNA-binding domain-containing protein [Terriglobia bacterium]
MKLKMNAKWVETLKPGPKRRDYHDTDCPGLTLRVTPSGAKSWTLMYYAGKRRRRLTIGSFPAIGLHDARKQGQKKRGAIQLGADPAAEKKAAREAGTFGELAAQYLDAKKHKRSIREDARIVDVYLNPRFEHAAAKDVKRSDIGAMLQTVAADAPVMANRVLACIRGIYNWAIGAGLLESTPCLRLQPPAPEKSRTRCLTNDEIRAVWKALDASTSTAIADLYKLRLLTAQRGGEIMGAAWSEFDLESRWWTIPGSRTKNKLDHRVY